MKRLVGWLALLAAILCGAPASAQTPLRLQGQFSQTPSITSLGTIGVGGGLAVAVGTGFSGSSGDPPTGAIFLSGWPGVPTPLTVAWSSSTSLNLTLAAGTYTAGSYTIELIFPNGTTLVDIGALAITNTLTPLQIYAGCLIGDWPVSACTCSSTCTTGSAVVNCADTSGNAQDKNVPSSTAPTIKLSDPLFTQPNVTSLVGVQANSTSIKRSVFSFGDAGTAFGFWIGGNTIAAPAFALLEQYSPPSSAPNMNIAVNTTTGFTQIGWGGNSAATTIDIIGLGTILASSYQNDGGMNYYVNNANPVFGTAPAAYSLDAGGVYMTADNNSSPTSAWSGHWVEDWALNCVPTALQRSESAQYLNNIYGITAAPGFKQATVVAASTSNAPLRVLNSLTNYSTGTNVFLVSGAVQNACTTQSTTTSTWLDLLCPSLSAGSYDLLIENPDGRAATYPGAVTVTTATSDWTIFGLADVGSYIALAANMTCSPSPCISGTSLCSAWTDGAALGNTLSQSTGANQVTWYSGVGDSTFNFQPYVVFNGSTTYFDSLANMNLDAPSGLWILAVYIPGATGGTTNLSRMNMSSNLSLLQFTSTNVPECYLQGTEPAWGSAISGAHSFVCGVVNGASSTGTVSINVNNGTAVSSSVTASISTGAILEVGRNTTIQYANGKLAALVYLNAAPSPTQLTAWQTFVTSQWLSVAPIVGWRTETVWPALGLLACAALRRRRPENDNGDELRRAA